MKLIVITTDSFFQDEAKAINTLFKEGLRVLHLRKPHSKQEELSLLLEQIKTQYLNRIVLHDHFELVNKYQLKGYHLNQRNNNPKEKHTDQTISRSCHRFEELQENDAYDYLFLSPIFNSLSKPGYKKTFTEEELLRAKKENWIHEKIYALGGITPSNCSLVQKYGFGGIAVLGYLWSNYKENKDLSQLIHRFQKLQQIEEAL